MSLVCYLTPGKEWDICCHQPCCRLTKPPQALLQLFHQLFGVIRRRPSSLSDAQQAHSCSRRRDPVAGSFPHRSSVRRAPPDLFGSSSSAVHSSVELPHVLALVSRRSPAQRFVVRDFSLLGQGCGCLRLKVCTSAVSVLKYIAKVGTYASKGN
eukprot:5147356-Amphidinium_carterae.1